jgi:hypothetical protein
MKARRHLRRSVLPAILLAAALVLACGDDEKSGEVSDGTSPTAATGSPTTGTGAGEDALPAGEHMSAGFGTAVTFTVGEGWQKPVDLPDILVLERPRTAQKPLIDIAFVRPAEAYNPTEAQLVLGRAPADFVSWIGSHRLLKVEDEKAVSIGGLTGTQLEITGDAEDDFHLFRLSDGDYSLRYNDHFSVAVLNAGDSQVLIMYESELPADFDNIEADAEEILATLEFEE